MLNDKAYEESYSRPLNTDQIKGRNTQNEFSFLGEKFNKPYYKNMLIRHHTCLANNRYSQQSNYAYNVPNWKDDVRNCANYFNSNIVMDPYDNKNSPLFIAAQAPKPNNFPRFMSLLMTLFVPLIITIVEKHELLYACSDYWTSEKLLINSEGDNFSSSLISANDFYESRNLMLNSRKSPSIKLNHLHIYKWIDNSAVTAENYQHIINVYDHLRKLREISDPRYGIPYVFIHCSAGLGRTGTFIAGFFLYNEFKEAQSKNKPFYFSVFHIVKTIREMRYNAVLTQVQYDSLYQLANYLSRMDNK